MYFSSSSSSSSSDEEFIMTAIDVLDRPRLPRDQSNFFFANEDEQFKSSYGLSKNTVKSIFNVIAKHLEPNDARNMPVSAMNQLLLTLRFYTTGGYQYILANEINVCTSTVCRIINKVTNHIAELARFYIRMPLDEDEVESVSKEFSKLSGFPRVLGCVGSAHIPIQCPRSEELEPQQYENENGTFSLKAQVICDAGMRIRNLLVCPGSLKDTVVLRETNIMDCVEEGYFDGMYLLGGSTYDCTDYLLTPLSKPVTPNEVAYNDAHAKARVVIPKTFSLLKKRFPCIATSMRLKVQTAMKVILACAVLHNIAMDLEDPFVNVDDTIPQEETDHGTEDEYERDAKVREKLKGTIFKKMLSTTQ